MITLEARAGADQQPTKEPLQSPEIPRRRMKKFVVIAGPTYAGKSRLKKLIEERGGYYVENGIETFERRTGIETGHMNKSPESHRRFDGMQAKAFRKTTVEELRNEETVGWWETRLGAIITAEEMDKRDRQITKRDIEIARARKTDQEPPEPIEQIPVVTVLITADLKTRVERAYKEARDQAMERGEPIPTKSNIKRLVLERERANVADWEPNHPPYYIKKGKSPYHRNLIRPNGKPVYMIVIDNSKHISVEETYKKLMKRLEEFDVFEPLTLAEVELIARETQSDEVKGDVIFNSDEMGEKIIREPKKNGSRSKNKRSPRISRSNASV